VLAVGRAFLQRDPVAVRGLVAALRKAERLLQSNRGAAVAAIVKVLPHEDAAHVARALELYRRAVPEGPAVRPERIKRELPFLPPGSVAAAGLASTDLQGYVLATGGGGGGTPAMKMRWMACLACAFAFLIALLVVLADQRGAS
jgi:hypothetical protein